MRVRLPNGHVGELKLNVPRRYYAKTYGLGHQLYEIQRDMDKIGRGVLSDKLDAVGYFAAVWNSPDEAAARAEDERGSATRADIRKTLDAPEMLEISTRLSPSTRKTFAALSGQSEASRANTTPSLFSKNSSSIAQQPPTKESTLKNITPATAPVKPPDMAVGAGAKLILPRGESVPVTFSLVEAADVVPSHDPESFARNPRYPDGVQERAYHRDAAEQGKVIAHEQQLKTNLVLTNNPDAINGPPIVTPTGIVLGGNSRAMSLMRAYAHDEEHGKGSKYKAKLAKFAEQFGLNADQVQAMTRPLLVRVLDTGPADAAALHRLATALNTPLTGAMSREARTASRGRNVSPETLEHIGGQLAERDDTLRELLGTRAGIDILGRLEQDGVVGPQERGGLVSDSTGTLTEDGKRLVEDALLGAVIDDADLLAAAPKGITNKLFGALSPLARLRARGEAWDVTGDTKEALALATEIKAAGMESVSDLVAQRPLFAEDARKIRARVVALADALLSRTPRQLSAAFKAMAADAAVDIRGQTHMPGFAPATAEQSLAEHFGSGQVLRDGVVQEAGADYLVAERGPGGRVPGITFSAPQQAALPFGVKRDPLQASQRVRMTTTGHILADGHVVRHEGDAAALLAHIRKSAQEDIYAIATDARGMVLEIHRYTKGVLSASMAQPVEVAGHALSIRGAKTLYFIHNHPSGSTEPSANDQAIVARIAAVAALRGIETRALVIGGTRFRTFDAIEQGAERRIQPRRRATRLPVRERTIVRLAPAAVAVSSPSAAQVYLRHRLGDADGVLLLDTKNRPIGFQHLPVGKKLPEATADVLSAIERTNASAVIFNSPQAVVFADEPTPRGHLVSALIEAGAIVHDVIQRGESVMEGKHSSFLQPPGRGSTKFLEAAVSGELRGQALYRVALLERNGQALDQIREAQEAEFRQQAPGERTAFAAINAATIRRHPRFRHTEVQDLPGGGVAVRFAANDMGFTIEEIAPQDDGGAMLVTRYGAMPKPIGKTIAGAYLPQPRVILLRPGVAGTVTLDHEIEHLLEHSGLMQPSEIKVLDAALKRRGISPGVEARAEFVARELARREAHALGSPLRRVLDRIWDALSALANFLGIKSARGVLRQVESGAMLARAGVRPFPPSTRRSAVYQLVYHGSPHAWEPEPGFPHGRPRLDKIGTGQGATAYGWGWYSASLSDVAKSYTPRDERYEAALMRLYEKAEAREDFVAMEVIEAALMHETPSELEQRFINDEHDAEFQQRARRVIAQVAKAQPGFSLYQIDIPDDVIPTLLDWDKPLSEQSGYVKKILEKELHAPYRVIDVSQHGDAVFVVHPELSYQAYETFPSRKQAQEKADKLNELFKEDQSASGQSIYGLFRDKYGSDEAASKHLASIGIPGNKYLDGGSRAIGVGSHNYVLWDQAVLDRVALLERNGRALVAAREAQRMGDSALYALATDDELVRDKSGNATGISGAARQSIEAELSGIVARAQANGTFGLAPNGQPSKLNARQWAMVRSRRFREWFGDWEAASMAGNLRTARGTDMARSAAREFINKHYTTTIPASWQPSPWSRSARCSTTARQADLFRCRPICSP
jgi:DNA repair protein RadC